MPRILVLVGLLLTSACCTLPPAAEKYFDRSTPVDALKMFQYSIESEQIDTAYACLSPASQELLPASRLRWLGFVKIEEMENRSLRVLLLDSMRIPRGVSPSGDEAMIWLDYQMEGGIGIFLTLIDEEWFIDLPRTLEELGVVAPS